MSAPEYVIKENWFTREPNNSAKTITFVMAFILFVFGLYFLMNTFHLKQIMPASGDAVFDRKEYWRLWTTLFAHADMGHLLNNALLFIPLTYLLSAYFSFYFFPVLGILMGGVINGIVLLDMPGSIQLIGISGVVYWMGGAWFTLFLLIDSRKNLKYRFANVLFLLVMLFIPETYWPQVSYLSHFLGFVFGSVSAIVIYMIWQKTFKNAEVKELVEEDSSIDQSGSQIEF